METGERGPHQARLRGLAQTLGYIFRKQCSENDIRGVNRQWLPFSRIETVKTCDSIPENSSGIPEAKKNQSVTASDSSKVKQSITTEPTDVIVNEAKCADYWNCGHSKTFDGTVTSGYSVNVDNGATGGYNMTVDGASITGQSLAVSGMSTNSHNMIMYEHSVTDTVHENGMADRQVKSGVQKDKMGLIKREGVTICGNSEKGVPDVQYQTTVVKIKHTTKVQPKLALDNTATSGHDIDNMSIEGYNLTSGETPTKGYGKTNMIPVVIVLLLMSPAQLLATALLKPPQALPEACYDSFSHHGNDCPVRLHFGYEARYQFLNQTCCVGYPGMDFHCQMNYNKSGDQYSMMACLRSIDVPKGYTARMSYTSKGPQLHLSKLESSYISPHSHETRSWNITYQYGTIEKSKCSGIGQEQLCKGGGNEDNLCTCQLGFQPFFGEYYSGFTDEDPCFCVQMTCEAGTEAARNLFLKSESCEDLFQADFNTDFFCEKCETVPTTPVPSTTTTAFPNNDSRPDKPGRKIAVNFGITVGIPVSIFVCILLVLLLVLRKRISAIIRKCCDAVNRTHPGNAETGESRQMLNAYP